MLLLYSDNKQLTFKAPILKKSTLLKAVAWRLVVRKGLQGVIEPLRQHSGTVHQTHISDIFLFLSFVFVKDTRPGHKSQGAKGEKQQVKNKTKRGTAAFYISTKLPNRVSERYHRHVS